jgi:hypothetical protein
VHTLSVTVTVNCGTEVGMSRFVALIIFSDTGKNFYHVYSCENDRGIIFSSAIETLMHGVTLSLSFLWPPHWRIGHP